MIGRWDSLFVILIRLEGRIVVFLFPAGQRYFSLFRSVQTGFGVHTECYAAATVRNLLQGQSSQGVKLITLLYVKFSLKCVALFSLPYMPPCLVAN